MTNVIDDIISIESFGKKCVVLKGVLQSPHLKDPVKTIGIYQSLINNALSEHKSHQNIKKLYRHAGKCDNQQQLKYILKAAIVSTPEVFTNDSPIYPMTQTPFKKPSARKSMCFFTNILDEKIKTANRQVGAAKSKRKAVKSGTISWALKQKRKGNSKIND